MLDFFSKLLDPKSDLASKILIIVAIYLVALWLVFCFWVLVDANRRFKRLWLALIFFLMVLVLNFPALIFYLIIRPETDDDNVFYLHSGMEEVYGGVNVPIVNFTGKDGEVQMSLMLKVHKPEMVSEAHDMKVDVNWSSKKPDFKVQEKLEKVEEPKKEEKKKEKVKKEKGPGLGHKLKTFASNRKAALSNIRLPKRAPKDEESKEEKKADKTMPGNSKAEAKSEEVKEETKPETVNVEEVKEEKKLEESPKKVENEKESSDENQEDVESDSEES